jgi:hypothetical protein
MSRTKSAILAAAVLLAGAGATALLLALMPRPAGPLVYMVAGALATSFGLLAIFVLLVIPVSRGRGGDLFRLSRVRRVRRSG